MKRLPAFALLLLLSANAAAPTLERRVHFLNGWEGGEPMLLYYRFPTEPKLEVKSVRVAGLPIERFDVVDAFGKRELEITVKMRPGLDVTFDSVVLNGQPVPVAPTRVLYLKPKEPFQINYERLEQLPNRTLFLGMQIFNDSSQTVTIDKILYAPKGVASDRVLISSSYDAAFFKNLETWVLTGGAGLPKATKLLNSSALNLRVPPSKGFGAAIVAASFQKAYSCKAKNAARDPTLRFDTAYLSPIVVYRVGKGQAQFYPIPDQIIADICP